MRVIIKDEKKYKYIGCIGGCFCALKTGSRGVINVTNQ